MLIGAYGGRIWSDDRASGHKVLGVAIRFTLKKDKSGPVTVIFFHSFR
ncbi:MAG: hypothetical protein WCF90_10580 [Methanomicrobiales archaeon]